MVVKINTKAYFTVFEVLPPEIHANMAEEIGGIFRKAGTGAAAIVDWKNVKQADQVIGEIFAGIESRYREQNTSFVMTGICPDLDAVFRELPAYAGMNVVPTFPEAVDLVMMEKLERELLNPDE